MINKKNSLNKEVINEKMTLAEVVKEYPQTIPFLNDFHLDYCCGGHEAIDKTAKELGLDAKQLVENLNKIANKPMIGDVDRAKDIERFEKLSVDEMIDDIQETHHVYERELMDKIEDSLNKILLVHYPHHGQELTKLHHLYAQLKADLEEHFAKEERLNFPLMHKNPIPSVDDIKRVQQLEEEHSKAGDLIKEIQELTNNFTLPDDACRTYQYTFETMEALFNDIFIHIFKENSVLFPEYYEMKDGCKKSCRA